MKPLEYTVEPISFSRDGAAQVEPYSAMAKQIHGYAQDDTPSNVSVPESWAGIFMWALGRHGPIVLFIFSTWLLYNDNKASQAQIYKDNRETTGQMMEVAKAQIAVNAQVVAQMTEVKVAISAMVEEAKRAHQHTP